MLVRDVVAGLLRGVSAVLERQDVERARFEVEFLREFGELKAQGDANAAMLKEIHGWLGVLVRKQEQQASDLQQHVRDRLRHVAA